MGLRESNLLTRLPPPPQTHTIYQHLTTVAGEPGTARAPRLPRRGREGEGEREGLSGLSKPQHLPCYCFLIWKMELVVALRSCLSALPPNSWHTQLAASPARAVTWQK